MLSRTWIREVTSNDVASSVLRLTDAKACIPAEAFISGAAPDPLSPPAGKLPIEITWPNGNVSRHFVREDTNRYMITDRTDAVRKFYSLIGKAGSIAITALEPGKFLITPVEVN